MVAARRSRATASTSGRPPPLASPRDEARALYRRAILRAAEDVFADNDFHTARMNDIAARARLAVGTIYNHFEHKLDVLVALFDERMSALVTAVEPAADDPSDFAGALEARVGRMLAFVKEHRQFFVLANEYGLIGASRAARQIFGNRKVPKADGVKNAFRELVKGGVAAGELAAIDAERLMRFLIGAIRVATPDMIDDPKSDPSEAAREVVALFFEGARKKKKK